MARGRSRGMPKQGGRKAGTPNKVPSPVALVRVALREAAEVYTEQALTTLEGIMNDAKAPPQARVAAANALLDRGHGRPAQAVALTDADGRAPVLLRVVHQHVDVLPAPAQPAPASEWRQPSDAERRTLTLGTFADRPALKEAEDGADDM